MATPLLSRARLCGLYMGEESAGVNQQLLYRSAMQVSILHSSCLRELNQADSGESPIWRESRRDIFVAGARDLTSSAPIKPP
jgi:xanthosine utilization system XapX-like protein